MLKLSKRQRIYNIKMAEKLTMKKQLMRKNMYRNMTFPDSVVGYRGWLIRFICFRKNRNLSIAAEGGFVKN